jgi:hypothetical protein
MRVNDDDETGFDMNSFVKSPAHVSSFMHFGAEAHAFAVDEVKRIVTGVAIMADQKIYRNDAQLGPHDVIFPPKVIEHMRNKFFKNNYQGNINQEHRTVVGEGVTLVEAYIVSESDPRYARAPLALAGRKITDGSLIFSYYVENPKVWAGVLSGEFTGFSIEGFFDKKQIVITNNKQQTKMKKNRFLASILGATPVVSKFSEALTAEGVVLNYEGDLVVGTVLTTDVNGAQAPAPEGDHEITAEGITYAVTLDASGAIVTIDTVEAMSEEAQGITEAMAAVQKSNTEMFAALEAKITAQEAKITAQAQALQDFAKTGKFSAKPAASGDAADKHTFKKLLS